MADSFFAELKRRRVHRVGIAYAIVGYAVIEAADVVFPNIGLGQSAVTLVIALVVLGLPLAVVLSWMFDATPTGIERTEPAGVAAGVAEPSGEPAAAAPPAAAEDHAAPAPASPRGPVAQTEDTRPPTAIAILPFANMSDSSENEYFSDGITEDILAHLAMISALDVVSHTSVRRYKGTDKSVAGIARELNVGTVLEGSVRRAGDRVRIVAQLIDARSDHHLWAETYDRDLTDIFAVQSEVAKSIAGALEAELTEEEEARLDEVPTESVEAYELVLRGRYLFSAVTEVSMKAARDQFEAALDLQPHYPAAVAGLTWSEFMIPYWATTGLTRRAPRIERIQKGLEGMDPASPEAHYVAGQVEVGWGWDWAKAKEELDTALELGMHDDGFAVGSRSYLDLVQGDPAAAARRSLAAAEALPDDPILVEMAGLYLIFAGESERAIEISEPWVTKEPLHFFPPMVCGMAYAMLGEAEKALSLLARAREVSHKAPLGEVQLIRVLKLLGRDDEAAQLVSELLARSEREHISGYILAASLLMAGDEERSFDELERALEERDPILTAIGGIPQWRAWYGHPRFRAVWEAVFPGRELPTSEDSPTYLPEATP
jgi:adenylate cyclase